MSRRVRASACALALAALAWAPGPAAAHAIGGTFQLPVPLWLYLAGAATAVGASFGVIALLGRRKPLARPVAHIPRGVARPATWFLRILGLVSWYGAIGVGFVIGDISPLPAVLLWVGIWIALPIVAAAIGNPWPSMSPFRTTFALLDRLASSVGLSLDLGFRYPERLARWPAVLLLGVAIWAELIMPGSQVAATVAAIMAAYTLLTLLGMLAFGPAAWLRNAEIFEVLLGWYGRIGPISRRAFRGWFGGFRVTRGLGWSDAAFVVLMLAGITYDGLRETAAGSLILTSILGPINAEFGLTLATFLLVDTAFLAMVYVAFLVAFAGVVTVTRRLEATGARADRGATAAAYAATLVPIAAGYLAAHYLTLVIQAATWLPTLVVNPLMSVAPDVGWIPIGLVWYASVGTIVGGHVAGVTLAHRLSLDRAGRNAVAAGLPMVLLMIGYTVLSLWIIAQPIVVEPV